MRPRFPRARATMPPMTEDTHAQANAEQVRVLREALAGAGQAGEEPPQEGGEGSSAPAPSVPPAPLP